MHLLHETLYDSCLFIPFLFDCSVFMETPLWWPLGFGFQAEQQQKKVNVRLGFIGLMLGPSLSFPWTTLMVPQLQVVPIPQARTQK